MKEWIRLSSKILHKNPWYSYKMDEFEIVKTGYKGKYYYLDMNGSSMIIASDNEGKILIAKMYRYLIDKITIELPCGGRKDNQTFKQAAKAELEEETGYVAQKFIKIGEFVVANGITNEYCSLFAAKNLIKKEQKFDPTEDIEIMFKSLYEINEMIALGEIIDGMTITGIKLYEQYLAKSKKS